MQAFRGKIDYFRDRWAFLNHTSTFRRTGEITPEEFVLAGDYLVYKFPSWAWSAAASPSQAVSYLPPEKQYLVTRGVPCYRQLNAGFGVDGDERVVQDGEGLGGGEEEGWLSTGGGADEGSKPGDVKALGDKGEVERDEEEEEEEIPDMDEDDDEAIIREPQSGKGTVPARTYTLYITYTPYYRTPRLYLSGYLSTSTPLAPTQMLEDIVGDYKDKTVTLEDFPFFDSSVKMASIHPCKHANVMKVLLDRADAAMKLRKEKLKEAKEEGTSPGAAAGTEGLEGLVEDTKGLSLKEGQKEGSSGNGNGDEWEVLQHDTEAEDDVAIRVDQYIVVFLKFMASVTPGIEHDFTMGV